MEFEILVVLVSGILGFLRVWRMLTTFCKWVWAMFFRPAKNLKEYGSWVMITGATEGIGRAFSMKLASLGLNLILIGRNESRLQVIHGEIMAKYQVKVRKIVIDLARESSEEIKNQIRKGIKGIDIGILINNAGITYPYSRYLHEVDTDVMEEIVKVNVVSTTAVTMSVLPNLVKKKKGAIVNIGSGATDVLPSFPLRTVYAATKSYISMFSRSVAVEYKKHGIDVQCQIPLFVATRMSRASPSVFVPSPESYAEACLRWIGYEPICIPYWAHSLQAFIVQLLPNCLLDWWFLKYFERIRSDELLRESTKMKI